jgi:hypothetical protein
MLSRINSTGRQRIAGEMASFAFVTGATRPTFAASFDLSTLADLPPESHVFVEAHRQNAIERFDFGTVARPAPRGPTELRELTPESLRFRVKVVEPGSGKLLALGDRFSADESEHGGRQPLLAVKERDLGPEPWRTVFEDDEAVLVLNERIPDAIGRLRTDQLFQALILPAAFRQILLTLWATRRDEAEEAEEDDWCSRWLRFVRSLVDRDVDFEEEEDTLEWVNEACRAFAGRHDFLSAVTGAPDQ